MTASERRPDATDGARQHASSRWRELVRARTAQKAAMLVERQVSGSDSVCPSRPVATARRQIRVTASPWWLPAGEPLADVDRDPLFRRLRQVTGPGSVVADVGAGTGRLSLRLAPWVAHVLAIDESARNLAELADNARALGLHNVTVICSKWPDAGAGVAAAADVVFSSYVLPRVEDAVPFLAGLTAAARKLATIQMAAMHPDALFDPLWQHYHGTAARRHVP